MFKHLLSLFLLCSLAFSTFAQKKKQTNIPSANMPQTNTLAPNSGVERMAAFEKRKALAAKSLVNNVKFRSVGPTIMSGRVVDIDVNPENPSEFFVAYASGGLWKTQNNGQSFTPLFDNEAVMTIGDIAVDWKTNGQSIWVGTGESNSSRSSYAGLGVYKTADGGKTWQHLGLSESHHIGRIVLHPTDPNVAWVAVAGHLYTPNAERGIYKTNDGGKTWQQTLFIDQNTGAIWLEADPSNANTLYACMWYKTRKAWDFEESGAASGIYKSTDAGQTWKNISTVSSGFPQGVGNGRIGVAVSPQNPNLIYAVMDNQANRPEDVKETLKNADKLTATKLKAMSIETFLALDDAKINDYLDEKGFPEKYSAKGLKEQVKSQKIKVLDIVTFTDNANDDLFNTPIVGAEVYRSEDGGNSWKRANTDYLDNIYSTYGYYFGNIWVSPSNSNKIVLTAYQLIRSEDSGKTFKSMNADNAHADHHTLWINPKNDQHLILGNDGGINISYDNGKTWFHANTPAVGQFYAVNVDMAKPYNVYGGLQDNGVWTGPSTYKHDMGWYSDGEYPYKRLMGGDGMQVAVDTRDNQTVYTGYQFGNYFRINKATGEQKYLTMPQEMGDIKNRFNWQSPILLSKHNQDIVYFGGNRFFRSMDKGENWKTLSPDLTKGGKQGNVPFGTITTIDESALKFGLLYIGTDDGLVQISKDGGYNWSKVSDGLPQNLWITKVSASNVQESRVYCSLNGYRDDHFVAYVYVSEDYGQTWQNIGQNLPAEPINVVKEDPKNQNILYVGTDHALYISLDRGKNFMQFASNLPATPVHDLVVHPRDNELVVGTHGRSIWIADVSLIQQLSDSVLTKELYVFPLKSQNTSPFWGRIRSKYEEAKPLSYEIAFYQKKAEKTTVKIQTDKGLILKTLQDDAETGLNFASYDLTIDKAAVADYEKYLNDIKKKDDKAVKLEEGQDTKVVYIKAGKYKVIIESASGAKTESTLEIKTTERKSKRG